MHRLHPFVDVPPHAVCKCRLYASLDVTIVMVTVMVMLMVP